MATIEVQELTAATGWRFSVTVTEGTSQTRHEVTLDRAMYERLTGGEVAPQALVREAFVFLLEHEPKESILRAFDVTVIGRYFPQFEEEIRRRLRER
jgi:hypothetical protein